MRRGCKTNFLRVLKCISKRWCCGSNKRILMLIGGESNLNFLKKEAILHNHAVMSGLCLYQCNKEYFSNLVLIY